MRACKERERECAVCAPRGSARARKGGREGGSQQPVGEVGVGGVREALSIKSYRVHFSLQWYWVFCHVRQQKEDSNPVQRDLNIKGTDLFLENHFHFHNTSVKAQ